MGKKVTLAGFEKAVYWLLFYANYYPIRNLISEFLKAHLVHLKKEKRKTESQLRRCLTCFTWEYCVKWTLYDTIY